MYTYIYIYTYIHMLKIYSYRILLYRNNINVSICAVVELHFGLYSPIVIEGPVTENVSDSNISFLAHLLMQRCNSICNMSPRHLKLSISMTIVDAVFEAYL